MIFLIYFFIHFFFDSRLEELEVLVDLTISRAQGVGFSLKCGINFFYIKVGGSRVIAGHGYPAHVFLLFLPLLPLMTIGQGSDN